MVAVEETNKMALYFHSGNTGKDELYTLLGVAEFPMEWGRPGFTSECNDGHQQGGAMYFFWGHLKNMLHLLQTECST